MVVPLISVYVIRGEDDNYIPYNTQFLFGYIFSKLAFSTVLCNLKTLKDHNY